MPREHELGYSVLYFPVIGLFIGLLLFLISIILIAMHTLPPISAALVLTVWVVTTGGLHLDGLADSVDAWSGGRGDHERTLAIMKEPQCGAMAIIAVCLVLLIKYSTLVTLLEDNQLQLIVIAPILGRLALPLLFLSTPYIRPLGLGALMAHHLPRQSSILIVTTMSAGIVLCYGSAGMIAVLTGSVVYIILWLKMIASIGGMTGDTAGAMVELVETISLTGMGLISPVV